MIRIDLENHFYAPCLIDALAQRSQPPFYDRATDQIHWTEDVCMPQGELLQRLLEVGEHRLSLLEQQGITHAVLSCSPGAEQLEPAKSIAVCQATNAALYELTRAHPGRLFGSAILPVKDVAAAERELERCVKEYGFVSWHTHSNYGNTAPDDPRYLPLFRKAAELGVYVYLHPQLPEGSRYAATALPLPVPVLALRWIRHHAAAHGGIRPVREIPSLRLVLGHLGEGLPFLLDRIENRIKFLPNPAIRCRRPLRYYFQHNIWVTTSGNMSPEAFRCTQDVLGMDHILFASDYPYESVEDMMAFLRGIPLNEADYARLYYQNAEALLGISLS